MTCRFSRGPYTGREIWMDKEQNTYDKWIAEGYDYFAVVGPVKFSIKALSEKTGLSRTSFHYYFSSKEEFFDLLIEEHYHQVTQFNLAIRERKIVSPEDLGKLLNEYAVGVRFQYRLFLFRHIDRYNQAYVKGHEINLRNGLMEWLMNQLGVSLPLDQARRVYYMLTDVFYTRLNSMERKEGLVNDYGELLIQTISDFKLLIGHQ